MVKDSIEVSRGTARFRVTVLARSIRRAISLVNGRYPRGDVRGRVDGLSEHMEMPFLGD